VEEGQKCNRGNCVIWEGGDLYLTGRDNDRFVDFGWRMKSGRRIKQRGFGRKTDVIGGEEEGREKRG
jgi:hypothetical protein